MIRNVIGFLIGRHPSGLRPVCGDGDIAVRAIESSLKPLQLTHECKTYSYDCFIIVYYFIKIIVVFYFVQQLYQP